MPPRKIKFALGRVAVPPDRPYRDTVTGYPLARDPSSPERGDFDVLSIATAGGLLPIVRLPGIFIGFMFIMTIKLRKSPFDISTSHHAHQEIVKGITTEMSGPMLGIFEISEWYEKVFLTAIVGLFFVNGSPLSYVAAVIAMTVAYFVEILIDNSCARLSWEQMLKSSWFVTIVFGGINIIVLQLI